LVARDHQRRRQPVAAGEVEIAGVVRGHGHDRAGPVAHQHIIGDVNRDAMPVDRVHRVRPGENARALAPLGHPVHIGDAPRLRHVGFHLGALRPGRHLVDQRVLRRKHHETHAEDGIHARREDPHLAGAALDGDIELDALGAPDPFALLRFDAFRPVDAVQPSSSLSAYSVILKNHCGRFFLTTGARSASTCRPRPPRSPEPSLRFRTSSPGASLRYASPRS
jgi:hypothetical protein